MTRAEPGAARTADRLTALGFQPVVAPLLAVRRIAQAAPDLTGIAALAFTSRNGVEAFAGLSGERALPVFAVGDATADAARGAGFEDVRSAGGALEDLARLLCEEAHGAVLVPGALAPAGDLPARLAGRVEARTLPVYEAAPTGAPAPRAFDAVLVQSPRGAQALAALGPFAGQVAVAISQAAAAPLTDASGLDVRVAQRPDEPALLQALGKPAARV